MRIPGDPSPEELQIVFEQLHERACQRWGAERAAVLEQSLRDASLAIARLERVRFALNDAPGFYLQDLALEVTQS